LVSALLCMTSSNAMSHFPYWVCWLWVHVQVSYGALLGKVNPQQMMWGPHISD
jgi:hypothetical protein